MTRQTEGQNRRRRTKVFLVDDHLIVRQGLVDMINRRPDLTVCGEAESAQAALDGIERSHPDIAVVDISLKGRSGLDLIKDLRQRGHRVPVLVLSMLDEMVYADRALKAGARGYIMKEEVPTKFLTAIRQVVDGKLYASEQVISKLLERAVTEKPSGDRTPLGSLSDRELEVFRMIGHGRSTRQVAEQLHLSMKTIETYRARVMEKLGFHNSAELVRCAAEWSERGTIFLATP